MADITTASTELALHNPELKKVRLEEEDKVDTSSSSEDSSDIEGGGASSTYTSLNDLEAAQERREKDKEEKKKKKEHAEFNEKVQPVCLSFDNLRYSVSARDGFIKSVKAKKNPFKKIEKVILKEMSGHFLPGRLTAIMGPSGAGKTTFLNLLSGRVKQGKISGKIQVNGQKRKVNKFKQYTSYVMQEDTLLGNLTAKELLTYAAHLRLPRDMSRKEKKERVKWIIDRLGLTRCQNTRVGVPGVERGISGGERRRVSIGLELITNPTILFLDEPTSGLDSTTAETVVEILKDLAAEGRTIICTIHQPSSEIFQKFDDLYLLANGYLTYSGPVAELPKFFKRQGFPCPKFSNPADHVMRLMSRLEASDSEYQERVEGFASYREKNNNLISIGDKEKSRNIDLNTMPHYNVKKAFVTTQFFYLLTRSWKQYVRDPGTTSARLMQNLVVALISGLLFLQLGHSQASITNRAGGIFVILMFSVFATGNSVLHLFPLERPNFLREYANGMYSVFPYYLAKSTADLPFNIVFPVIFTCISYWMIGLRQEADAFFTFMAFVIIIANISQSIGLLVSVGLDLQIALGLFPVTVIPFLLVGGLFLNIDDFPPYFYPVQYLSFFFYTYTALAINEFENVGFHCSDDEYVVTSSGEKLCPIENGDKFLSNLHFDRYEIYQCALALMGLYVVLRLMAFLALFILAKKKGTA